MRLTIPEVITIIRDLAIAFSAVFTAIYARKGLNQWYNQMVGKAKYDAAREFLRQLIELERSFGKLEKLFVLFDLVYNNKFETKTDYDEVDNNLSDTSEQDISNEFIDKINIVQDNFRKLENHFAELKIIHGNKLGNILLTLRSEISHIYFIIENHHYFSKMKDISVEEFIEDKGHHELYDQSYKEFRKKSQSGYYKKLFENIEKEIRPFLNFMKSKSLCIKLMPTLKSILFTK